jgi:hypothetical protein
LFPLKNQKLAVLTDFSPHREAYLISHVFHGVKGKRVQVRVQWKGPAGFPGGTGFPAWKKLRETLGAENLN